MVIREIETMESAGQNIWVPIGILEVMYNDFKGCIDYYFHSDPELRSIEWLWNEINKVSDG